MSNYSEFMAALREQRQKELRQQAVLGLDQKHQEAPDTRLLPLPSDPTPFHPENQKPSWINQVNHHMDLPEIKAELDREKRREQINSTLYGQKQRVSLTQLITRRALRRLNHHDDR